jgi:hypothetical protein
MAHAGALRTRLAHISKAPQNGPETSLYRFWGTAAPPNETPGTHRRRQQRGQLRVAAPKVRYSRPLLEPLAHEGRGLLHGLLGPPARLQGPKWDAGGR